MSKNTTLRDDVIQLTESLLKVYKRIREESKNETVDETICDILRVPICLVADIVVPDIRQKIHEIIYANEHSLSVNKNQYGADLFKIDASSGDESHIEHKTSKCLRNRRCNFNWPIPPARLPKEERRKRLLKSIAEKTGGPEGHVVLEIVNGVSRPIKTYKLSGRFLIDYFSRLQLGECNNHNMGCNRCRKCGEFHRLQKLQIYSNCLEKKGHLTPEEWKEVFSKTIQSCTRVSK